MSLLRQRLKSLCCANGRPEPSAKKPAIWDGYTADAIALAQWVDCSHGDLEKRQQYPERIRTEVSRRSCNWYLPPFENPFYGGIMTILRLAAYLKETDGVRQKLLICGVCDPIAMSTKIAKAFPVLDDVEVYAIDSPESIDNIPPSDYSVATLWTTAYVLLKVQNTGYKFYMIQDYEPLFYPAGSTYAQAELTYRFGFYGIANTKSLAEIYEKQYAGRAVVLTPNVDTSIFFRGNSLRAENALRVFYYARPGIPRNGFELAVAALRKVKGKLGEKVKIICAGETWQPADYGLGDVVEAVGILPYEQTADLYRSCHVGLSLMMSKHPSYLPFELMACGTLVVANRNDANSWFLKNEENCLVAEPTASCLADRLEHALLNYESCEPLRRCAAEQVHAQYGSWDASMRKVADFMHSPSGF